MQITLTLSELQARTLRMVTGQADIEKAAAEAIQAGLRMLEDPEAKRERLRQMLDDGERSGFAAYSYDDLIAELDRDNH